MNNDLISREALKKVLSGKEYITYTYEYGNAIPVEWVMNAIDNAPTVSFIISPDYVTELQEHNKELIKQLEDMERPQGEWISLYEKDSVYAGECSCCHWKAVQYEDDVVGMPYCPNCGADMKGEEE